MKKFVSIINLLVCVCFSGCSSDHVEKKSYRSLDDINKAVWELVSQKKIYFGHQSVGKNIMDGIRMQMEGNNKIEIQLVDGLSDKKSKGGFYNTTVGKNRDPFSKTDEFLANVNGNHYDIAFLKYCYVDITNDTNPNEVFEYYKKKIESLKIDNPDLVIVHFTAPLMVIKKKTLIMKLKGLLGSDIDLGHMANVKRNEYNQLIIKEYKGKEPVFDIAELESTLPDGSREMFMYNDRSYSSMYPGYTDDGGHLNDKGKMNISEQLLVTLVNIVLSKL